MVAGAAAAGSFSRYREPERLVGLGFRAWLAGYQTGDISCWEEAWSLYSETLGPEQARPAVEDLASWVRAIRKASFRAIEVYPSQHGACPALRACAFALLENSAIDDVVEGAECLGARLKSCNKILSPNSICQAVAFCPLRTRGRPN